MSSEPNRGARGEAWGDPPSRGLAAHGGVSWKTLPKCLLGGSQCTRGLEGPGRTAVLEPPGVTFVSECLGSRLGPDRQRLSHTKKQQRERGHGGLLTSRWGPGEPGGSLQQKSQEPGPAGGRAGRSAHGSLHMHLHSLRGHPGRQQPRGAALSAVSSSLTPSSVHTALLRSCVRQPRSQPCPRGPAPGRVQQPLPTPPQTSAGSWLLLPRGSDEAQESECSGRSPGGAASGRRPRSV